MSANGVKVVFAGRERFLVCTTAAYEMICDKYGGLAEMTEIFKGPTINEWDSDEVRAEKAVQAKKASGNLFKVAPWLVATLANQGEMLTTSVTRHDNPELLTEERVKLLTSPKEISELTRDCMQAIAIGFGTEHVSDGPSDPILEELDRKNAEGAAE